MSIKLWIFIVGLAFTSFFWFGFRSQIIEGTMSTENPWMFLLGKEYKTKK